MTGTAKMNNTVIKAVEIMRLIAKHPDGLSLAEITRELVLSKSTVYNIIKTLEQEGLLQAAEDRTPVYRMGIETLKLGLSYLGKMDMDSVARPVLSRLCNETNETVFMSVPCSETEHVYVMKYLSSAEFQTVYTVGAVRTALSTAMGKAILSARSDEEIRRIMTPELFRECTLPEITDTDSLLDYLHRTQKLGYVADFTAENPRYASAVAAPVFDMEGKLVSAISIVIMQSPNDRERIRTMGEKVHAAALLISRGLGYLKEDLYG